MSLHLKSLKNGYGDNINISIDIADSSDRFYDIDKFGNLVIHFVDDLNEHLEGYFLIGLCDKGLFRIEHITNSEHYYGDDATGDLIASIEVEGRSNLKIIGVDIL